MNHSSDMPTYVMGHKNPDTDAICAAVGYADLLQKKGAANVQPARCGSVPNRTAWVLEQAGVEAPLLLNHVYATAEMICIRDVVRVSADATFLTAYQLMLTSGVRSIPVVDDNDQLCGLLRYLDLLQLIMPMGMDAEEVRRSQASPVKIAETLKAEICGAPIADEEREIVQLVGASSVDVVEERLDSASLEGDVGAYVVICGNRPEIHQHAIKSGVCMLVVTGGFKVADDLVAKATENGVVILHCKQDTGTVSKLIRCARKVKEALDADVVCVRSSDTVDDLKDHLAKHEQSLFPVIDDATNQFIGVITKSCLLDPPHMKMILVDHNEFSQAVTGIESAEIIEVLDHHRLSGDVMTSQPIRYINEPVGSSATLVAREYRYAGIEVPKGIAMCLIAGMVTDTLNLTSPTTADLDREILPWLCEIAGVDAAEFTRKIFESGSLLANNTAAEAIDTDRKSFQESGSNVSISHIEECGLDLFAGRRADLEKALEDLVAAEGYDLALLIVTDVTKHHSVLLARGNDAIIEALPYSRDPDGLFQGPGIVSRKKQVFPDVCQALSEVSAATA